MGSILADILREEFGRGTGRPRRGVCQHPLDQISNGQCYDCGAPLAAIFEKARHHTCCWLWKAALIGPLLHILLHLFGVPHPEIIAFLP